MIIKNLPGDPSARPGWKSYSLQRGAMPPSEEEAARLQAETMVIIMIIITITVLIMIIITIITILISR